MARYQNIELYLPGLPVDGIHGIQCSSFHFGLVCGLCFLCKREGNSPFSSSNFIILSKGKQPLHQTDWFAVHYEKGRTVHIFLEN